MFFENYDLHNVILLVNVDVLEDLLIQSDYDPAEIQFLANGFRNSFSLGYSRNTKVQLKAPNLKLRVGNETILWNKVMKEVKVKCYAGPFAEIPFSNDFIQSHIGLVAKDNGKDFRLIFHLSYPRNNRHSVNTNTPVEDCWVKYMEFNQAICLCSAEGICCKISKSDMKSAFCHLGISPRYWRYLIMKAKNPKYGKYYYFVDKCLPFGAEISCVHFQRFSNAVAHLVRWHIRLSKGVDKPFVITWTTFYS